MIRPATLADLPSIRPLLDEANDMPYDLRAVAEEKCFERGYEGAAVARIAGDFDGISVTCGKYLRLLGVRRAAHGRGIGTALLRDAESRGASVVAAEPGNYFTPGVLESMAPFFRKGGYAETATTNNLVCDTPVGWRGSARVARNGQRSRVLEFIEEHFGPIWRFEAARSATIVYVEHEGAVAGFATHEANNQGLGWFGPTGVAKELRGLGYGRELLLASLADLRRLGYDRAVIPWTDAVEFYRKSCNARLAHRFVILRRS